MKDYRTAQVLALKPIARFLEQRGYRVVRIVQPWRHVTAHVRSGREHFFVKLASTVALSDKIRNEIAWNRALHQVLRRRADVPFRVPLIVDEGQYGSRSFFVSTYHPPHLLATRLHRTRTLQRWVPSLVHASLFLLRLPAIPLPHDTEDRRSATTAQRMYETNVEKWYRAARKDVPAEVFRLARSLDIRRFPGVTHGDLVPWHMLRDGKRFVLIDAEHASSRRPKFYDVVCFAHRVCTNGYAPHVADAYLRLLRRRLTDQERRQFDQLFRPLLALRIIGGFWDAAQDGSDLRYHRQLLRVFQQRKKNVWEK